MQIENKDLEEILAHNREKCRQGKLASYIPALGKANPTHLGICIAHINGELTMAGECTQKFTMQSISKVFSFLLAILDRGTKRVLNVVGLESTGDAFNSIVKLETGHKHKPYNPMINAGAIEIASLIKGASKQERFAHLLDFYRTVAEDQTLELSEEVYQSEEKTGNRNRSIAYFLQDAGLLHNPVEETLDLYFRQCSIQVTTVNLAKMGLFLARGGVLSDGTRIVDEKIVRLVRSQIAICGMYDGSGTFAARVGIPSKSGVGGGILSAVAGEMGIGVYGPALDGQGNSVAGIAALEELSNQFSLAIF